LSGHVYVHLCFFFAADTYTLQSAVLLGNCSILECCNIFSIETGTYIQWTRRVSQS